MWNVWPSKTAVMDFSYEVIVEDSFLLCVDFVWQENHFDMHSTCVYLFSSNVVNLDFIICPIIVVSFSRCFWRWSVFSLYMVILNFNIPVVNC